MTDGIIQKVISEYINMEINAKKKGYNQMHTSIPDMLKLLQQELIEEIKKEFIPIQYRSALEIRKILIGDNQE